MGPPSSAPYRAFVFFSATAPGEFSTLSLHDALPISVGPQLDLVQARRVDHLDEEDAPALLGQQGWRVLDRKSTRLNSSHMSISYAVFCLKKKKKKNEARHAVRPARVTGARPRHSDAE